MSHVVEHSAVDDFRDVGDTESAEKTPEFPAGRAGDDEVHGLEEVLVQRLPRLGQLLRGKRFGEHIQAKFRRIFCDGGKELINSLVP